MNYAFAARTGTAMYHKKGPGARLGLVVTPKSRYETWNNMSNNDITK